MKTKSHTLIFACFLLGFFVGIQADNLQFFVGITRNGIRNPYVNLTTGATMVESLTPAGMRQQYLLGTYYAQRYRNYYPGYLDTNYDPYDLYVRSSDKDRCLNSAQSLLLGLFPFGSGPNVTGSVPSALVPPLTLSVDTSGLGSAAAWNNYQPTAIHSTSTPLDFLLRAYYTETCPNLVQIRNARMNDATYQNISALVAPTVAQIKNTMNIPSNISLNTLADMFQFYESIVSTALNGFNTSISLTSDLFRTITFLAQFHDLYINHGTTSLIQTGMSPILTEILSNLNATAYGINNLEESIYIGHDDTLTGLMAVLGLVNYQCVTTYYFNNQSNDNSCTAFPTFSAHIELELTEDSSNNLWVIVLYNGVELTPCGGARCTLAGFQSLVSPYVVTPAQYQSLCGNIMLTSAPYSQYAYSSNSTTSTTGASTGGGNWGLILLNIVLAVGLFATKKYGRDFVKSQLASRSNQNSPQDQQLGQELRPIQHA